MSVRFRVETLNDVREFEFDRAKVTVGRGPLNDVVVANDSVAPRHGVLRVEDDGRVIWACRRGASSQFVRDGEAVDRADGSGEQNWELNIGDVVHLGTSDNAKIELLSAEQTAQLRPAFVDFDDAPVEGSAPILRDLAAKLADEECGPGLILSTFTRLLAQAGVRGGSSTFVMLSGPDDCHNVAWSIDDAGTCTTGADPTRFLGPCANVISARWREAPCVAVANDVALVPIGGTDAVIVYRSDKLSPGLLATVAQIAHWIRPYADLFLSRCEHRKRASDLTEENRYFRARQREHYLFKELVAQSDAMKAVHTSIATLAAQDRPVLIAGEAGTGKELLARFLHHESDRGGDVVLHVKCSQFADERANAELFGHTGCDDNGAPRQGIFELARNGTVFLEEIDVLAPPVQAKLCRALKEGEVRRVGDSVGRPIRARLVASVHRNLAESVADGRLRRDLYLLFRGQLIEVPALRDRTEDILPLAQNFLGVYTSRYARSIDGFTPDAAERLMEHDWPGNVRELQARIESAVLGTDRRRITVRQLGL